MGIIVKRPVRVMVVVTDQFKVRRSAENRTALAKLETVGKQLSARIESVSTDRRESESESASRIMERLLLEKRRNEQARVALRRELKKISLLETGTEYSWGTMEGTVEVEVGDDFSKLGVCEIVVKDDKIVEIRDGLCPEPNETL